MATATKDKYIEAVGRRKEASARVRISESKTSSYTINDKKLEEYFDTESLRHLVKAVIEGLDPKQSFSVSAKVSGGGIKAQAEAVRHGLARAIVKSDENYKKQLKDKNFLTRDARVKERYKFGLKKARKSPQWSKR